MSHSKWWVLLALSLGFGAASLLLLRILLHNGFALPAEGWFSGVVNLMIAGLATYLGGQVKRFKTHEETWVGAVGAARVAALSLALSHLGAILVGYFGAKVVLLAGYLGNEALAASWWIAVFSLVTSGIMLGVGRWVEAICTLQPRDPEQKAKTTKGRAPGGAAAAPA